MLQTLSVIIFFAVFIELLIALSVYLFAILRDFLRAKNAPIKQLNVEELNIKKVSAPLRDEELPPSLKDQIL